MSDDIKPPVTGAIETLVDEIERETTWLAELRRDIQRTETRRMRLIGAVDSAMQTLGIEDRRRLWLRLEKVRIDGSALSMRAERKTAIFDLIACQGQGHFTAAEIRGALERQGHEARPNYVCNALTALCRAGIVHRTGHGRYTINPVSPKLVWRRMQLAHKGDIPAGDGLIGEPA